MSEITPQERAAWAAIVHAPITITADGTISNRQSMSMGEIMRAAEYYTQQAFYHFPRLLAALTACEADRDAARQEADFERRAFAGIQAANAELARQLDTARSNWAGWKALYYQAAAERDAARDGAAGYRAQAGVGHAQLDRLAPLAATTGIPAPTLLRMAVDALLEPTDPPTFDAATDYLFAKNAALYRRLAAGPTQAPLLAPDVEQLGLLEDAT